MFRIKICGVTTAADARMVVAAGADAVGLNFYRSSKRYVSPEQARQVAGALPKEVLRVGLFVNSDAREIREHVEQYGLGLVQLHGEESPELLGELDDIPVMRAFRLRDALEPVEDYLNRCRALGRLPAMVLLDAYCPDQRGGTGKLADWSLAGRYARDEAHPPLVLAGGLTPENVADAIRTVQPAAIDTASGVESEPRRKDPQRTAAFIRNAREAFEGLMRA